MCVHTHVYKEKNLKEYTVSPTSAVGDGVAGSFTVYISVLLFLITNMFYFYNQDKNYLEGTTAKLQNSSPYLHSPNLLHTPPPLMEGAKHSGDLSPQRKKNGKTLQTAYSALWIMQEYQSHDW